MLDDFFLDVDPVGTETWHGVSGLNGQTFAQAWESVARQNDSWTTPAAFRNGVGVLDTGCTQDLGNGISLTSPLLTNGSPGSNTANHVAPHIHNIKNGHMTTSATNSVAEHQQCMLVEQGYDSMVHENLLPTYHGS